MRLARIPIGMFLLAALLAATVPVRTAAPTGPFDAAPPYLGLAAFGAGGALTDICSGVLLSPTVFLTAGHCTDGTDIALIWFESEVTFDPSEAAMGLPVTHPDHRGVAGFPGGVDVGVVMLDEPIDVSSFAVLPAVGLLDGMTGGPDQPGPAFTVMGYGLQAVVSFMQDAPMRYRGLPDQLGVSRAVVDDVEVRVAVGRRLRSGPANCLSDAGGPLMVGTTNVVAGVGSFASSGECGGIGTYSRLDTDRVSEFVLSFLR